MQLTSTNIYSAKIDSEDFSLPEDIVKFEKNKTESNSVISLGCDEIKAIIDADDTSRLLELIATTNFKKVMEIDWPNGTALHYASSVGRIVSVYILAKGGISIDAYNDDQCTALMVAILMGHNQVVNLLLRLGADIFLKGKDGMAPLHLAAKKGNVEACKLLVKSTFKLRNLVNLRDEGGWTPLVWACENNFVEVVAFLLNVGADFAIRDIEQNLAVHWAAFSDSVDVLELLLTAGSDPNTANVHGDYPV